MPDTLYPDGYGTRLVTMAELRAHHEPHMHPEYARRLFPWIESQGGLIGIGGGFRKTGEQPDKPGFAPEGQSFHQPQQWPDAPGCYAAVDLVARNPGKIHRSPTWAEVPNRGNADTVAWGLHCNVYPSEAWHMQPIEISGWKSWVAKGRPSLRADYPLPGAAQPLPPVQPAPPQEEDDDMNTARIWGHPDFTNRWLVGTGTALHLSGNLAKSYIDAGVPQIIEAHDHTLKTVLFQCGLTSADLVRKG